MLYKIITQTVKFDSTHITYCQESVLQKITFALIRNGHTIKEDPQLVEDHDLHEILNQEEKLGLKTQWEQDKLVYYKYIAK